MGATTLTNGSRGKITVPSGIKNIGAYSAEVWCYKETVAKITLNVIPE